MADIKLQDKINLKSALRYLRGVGPEKAKLLARLGLHTLSDLMYFFPRRHEKRYPVKRPSELKPGEKECVAGVIQSRGLIRTRTGQTIFRLILADARQTLIANWFNMPYLINVFKPKSPVLLYGKVDAEGRRFQMIHPEYELTASEGSEGIHAGRLVPVYPLTEDLGQKTLRQLAYQVSREAQALLEDHLPDALRKRCRLRPLASAIESIHFPSSEQDWDDARRRLVFDEFFFLQMFIQDKRQRLRQAKAEYRHLTGDEALKDWIAGLDFVLTQAQNKAMNEIVSDMKKDVPMNRLVHGDVGSGKTLVAAGALRFTTANGMQGAMMAPTEVLAQQHFYNLSKLLAPAGVRCGLLSQGLDARQREAVLRELRNGDIQVLIGTHALIQKEVVFKELGLAVVDEQHKFGVFQRSALKEKGSAAHFLLMTATPIPRTLAMTLYGDLDVSVVAERPKGRQPVQTVWVGSERRDNVYDCVEKELLKGRQAYVVCPKIDANSPGVIRDVRQTADALQAQLPKHRVEILHGKISKGQKSDLMKAFNENRIHVLVATVVVEVGVDTPNASIMVIENAERFGLAQLHQLRGRVGRGAEESACFLISDTVDDEAVERLRVFETLSSGFDIAEEDMRLRGAGDFVREKQHGFMKLRIGDLQADAGILEEARVEAGRILAEDPALADREHARLKRMLRIRFREAEATQALQA